MALTIRQDHPVRNTVDLKSDAARRHWVKLFGMTEQQLTAAIEKVGNNPETLRKELRRIAPSCFEKTFR
jgi:hypothetical protein